MLSKTLLVGAGLIWIGVLFGVALWGERRFVGQGRRGALVYTLALAVYCTSWTFYGTVAQAARYGWWVPPTFVGTILLFALAFPFLKRLAAVSRASNATSVADLIAARCGKSPQLAALVTLVALFGMVPYIALQLRAVAQTFSMLSSAPATQPGWEDAALWVAVTMALFALLFGTRRAAATEHNHGLMLAMAFESAFKLLVMLLVGGFVAFVANDSPLALYAAAKTLPPAQPGGGFLALVLLGALAMFTLPHQFHIGIVELGSRTQLRFARVGFPLYLLLIAAPIPLLAWAGGVAFNGALSADLYTLGLPLAAGASGLALLAFLGGVSAATGMVILAAITLSIMLANHWFAPLTLRAARRAPAGRDLTRVVLLQRRVAIVFVLTLAYLYSRALGTVGGLGDIGALSFSALAQLAPAVLVAVYWPGTAARAVGGGIVAGMMLWTYLLVLPVAIDAGLLPALSSALPMWLTPAGFFGLGGLDGLTRALLLALGLNALVVIALARRTPATAAAAPAILLSDLQALASRFLTTAQLSGLFRGLPAAPVAAPVALSDEVERALTAVVGSASARLLIRAAARTDAPPLATVAALVGEAAARSRLDQSLLEAALENMSQGISVVNQRLELTAWNTRYAALFNYPPELLQVGTPIEALVRYNAARGWLGADASAALIERRLKHMHEGTSYLTERQLPDGRVIEIRGNPMPAGGFVATFADVTHFRLTEAALRASNETLELRVAARTAESESARREAEQANRAKGHFLAAVGHDLMQPIHAAALLAASLRRGPSATLDQLDGALHATQTLIESLLDMARLDSGTLAPQVETFPLRRVLDPLLAEFRVLAAERGLHLDAVVTQAWVRSDPQLLRRILQNLLSNAVRYTQSGRILIGCRRSAGNLRIEVHDTGPGIRAEDHATIFEEFRRLGDNRREGLGLGLAITQRIAGLLGHAIWLRSKVGVGSVFALTLPRAEALAAAPVTHTAETGHLLAPALIQRVLVVDDNATVRSAMQRLLEAEGLQVLAVDGLVSARAALASGEPDLAVIDYHLADGSTGLQVAAALRLSARGVPTLIVSADRSESLRVAVAAAGLTLMAKPLKPLAFKSWRRYLAQQKL